MSASSFLIPNPYNVFFKGATIGNINVNTNISTDQIYCNKIDSSGSGSLFVGTTSSGLSVGNPVNNSFYRGYSNLIDSTGGGLYLNLNNNDTININSGLNTSDTNIFNMVPRPCANLPVTGGVVSFFNGQPGSSIALQEVFGDGTGWKRTFAKRASGVSTDVVTITDAGNINATGVMTATNLSNTNTGDITLTAVGAVPNANAASLVGQQLQLQPANQVNPGILTAGVQTIGGNKKFTDPMTVGILNFSNGESKYVASCQTIGATTSFLTSIDLSLGLQTSGKCFIITVNLTGVAISGGVAVKLVNTIVSAYTNAAGVSALAGTVGIVGTPNTAFVGFSAVPNNNVLPTVAGNVLTLSVQGYAPYTVNWTASIDVVYTYY